MCARRKRRILVVEDDADLRATLEYVLLDDGFDVISAGDGRAALRVLEGVAPDAILLDLTMPVMDGATFARRFRSQHGGSTPIVIYTATPRPRIAEEIGNAEVLQKPAELDHLLNVINRNVAASGD